MGTDWFPWLAHRVRSCWLNSGLALKEQSDLWIGKPEFENEETGGSSAATHAGFLLLFTGRNLTPNFAWIFILSETLK